MRIPFFDKRYYGLDKGSSGIKIAEITEARGRLAVTRLMKLSLPVEDLPLRPDLTPPAIVERLRVFCRGQGITGRSVAVNLSGAFVASRLFNLPVMSHAELQAYIQDHAQEYLPAGVSKDAVEFDFQILKEEVQTGAEMAQINLAAGRKEAVADVLAMTLGAGLYPSCVDASSLSLVNMFSLHPAFVPGLVSAIMDIGHSVTKTLVVRDGQVAFAYELAAGGDTVNRKLQEAFDLDYDAAEELKLLFSADHEADQAGTVAVAGREFPRESVRGAVREACASMADEIGRMQQLWKGGRPWQHVVITGGGAKTPGLAAALSDRYGCPVELMSAVAGLECDGALASRVHEFSLAIGLALKQVQPRNNSIDLLPRGAVWEVRDRFLRGRLRKIRTGLAWAAGGAMALLLIGWLAFLGLTKTAETQWAGMRDRWLEAKAVLDANTELQHGIAIIRKLPGRELDGPRIMYELSRMTPERSWLTSVSITSRLQQGEGENGIGTVLRMKLTGAAETEDQLIQLMRALERSQLLSKPELRMMERSREGTAGPLRFEIIAGVR